MSGRVRRGLCWGEVVELQRVEALSDVLDEIPLILLTAIWRLAVMSL